MQQRERNQRGGGGCKIRLKSWGKDLSQVESSKDKEISNLRHKQSLKIKYSIWVKTLGVAIEELKQRIVAIVAKVRRYPEKVDSSRQNRM